MSLTIEESTTDRISPLLQQLARNIVSDGQCCDSLQKDLLYAVIISLLLENDFYPVDNEVGLICDVALIDSERLKKWKQPMGLLQVIFTLNKFEQIPIKLIISPLGSTTLVNLVIVNLDSETYSVCLPVSRYVVSPYASTIPMIFRDLKHLSHTFKNRLLCPVKSQILGLCGYPGASLVGMPDEVLHRICLYLPVTDVVGVAQTCGRLKLLVDNESVWKKLYKRDFGDGPSERTDWKAMYREKFVANKEAEMVRRGRRAGSMHDWMDYADDRSYIDNPLWDNMMII